MNSPHILYMRHQLERWRTESALVHDDAVAVNLVRTRTLAPMAAALHAVLAVVFLAQFFAAPEDDPTQRWTLWLLCLHLGAALSLAACGAAASALRHSQRAWGGRNIGLVTVTVGIAFSIGEVVLEQWATAHVSEFQMACVVSGLVLYLRPLHSGLLYLAASVAFCMALGWSQNTPEHLLYDRIHGLVACGTAWVLSMMLWHKFTTIVVQRKQLEKLDTDLQQKQRELERLTRQDGLTGLFNRNTFVELSRRELDRAQRQGSTTTIMLLDLDHFKRINDTWGHPAGDAVLRHVATLTSTTVRSTDLVGRLGGEEFIVLLPNTSADAGRRLAEKVRQRLETTTILWEGKRIPVTASFGLASATAEEKHDFEHLYTEADKALYTAKQYGRNRVV